MNILFVDHDSHALTRSADFFLDLLRQHGEVRIHYYSRHYHCGLLPADIDWADAIIFWEFLPARFSCGVPGKRCVFVPMYDNEWGSVWLWRRLGMLGMGVVSFCDRITDHARRCGVKQLIDVDYFPPDCASEPGDPRKAILWERGQISFSVIKALFRPDQLDKVMLVRRHEEGLQYTAVSPQDMAAYHVEILPGGFIPADDYQRLMAEPGLYVAPRFKEGIGMSFLEQMARGKCVIAHDDATMNEYIENGRNGILVDMRRPRAVTDAEIAAVNAFPKDYTAARRKWADDQAHLREFFNGIERLRPLRSPWSPKSLLAFVLYWLEGGLMRFRQRFLRPSIRHGADASGFWF